jgi:hypothetical protein
MRTDALFNQQVQYNVLRRLQIAGITTVPVLCVRRALSVLIFPLFPISKDRLK